MKENEGAADGEQLSVGSPRRILNFKKDKRKKVAFPDGDWTGFGVSREHGLKPSEDYGFVGSITTIVATGVCNYSPFFRVISWFLLVRIQLAVSLI